MGYLSLLLCNFTEMIVQGTQVGLPLLKFVYKDVNFLFINSTNDTTHSFVETSHRYSWHKRPAVLQYYQYSRHATANFSWLGPIYVSFDMQPTAFYYSLRRNTHLEVELGPLTPFWHSTVKLNSYNLDCCVISPNSRFCRLLRTFSTYTFGVWTTSDDWLP